MKNHKGPRYNESRGSQRWSQRWFIQMDKRRMCPNCRAFITTDDKVCPYCQFTVGPKAVDRRTPADALGGLIPHARFTTMLIMLINTGLYVAMVLHTQAAAQGMTFDFDGRTLLEF